MSKSIEFHMEEYTIIFNADNNTFENVPAGRKVKYILADYSDPKNPIYFYLDMLEENFFPDSSNFFIGHSDNMKKCNITDYRCYRKNQYDINFSCKDGKNGILSINPSKLDYETLGSEECTDDLNKLLIISSGIMSINKYNELKKIYSSEKIKTSIINKLFPDTTRVGYEDDNELWRFRKLEILYDD